MKPKTIVFATGTKDGGGSGAENLVEHSHGGDLDADIVAFVSNHPQGGVAKKAKRLGIPFEYFPGPFDAEHYQSVVAKYDAEWIAASGWLKLIRGLDPARTFNIHPALLSFDNGRFGGSKLYGHHVHEAVKLALDAGEIIQSGPTMHFATEEFDRGPIFFEYPVSLTSGMSADEIADVVNKTEHRWQPRITNMVIHGKIAWDGVDPKSLRVPPSYTFLPK